MCGCCGKSDDDEKIDLSNPTKNRGCTDIIFLIIFLLFWAGMIYIAAFSVINGDAFRLIYGYDSFGNTCDEDNSKRHIENVTFSGQNLKGRPYVFFMDVYNPTESMEICVNSCPDIELKDLTDIQQFSSQTGSLLCRYDIDVKDYASQKSSKKGPCPVTPVPASKPLLNRCVPKDWADSAVKEKLNSLFSVINTSDIFQKILGDLYSSWQEMLALCFIAFGFSVLMVLLLRFLASLIVWVILAVAVVASIVATAFLWWTYATFKERLDDKEIKKIPLLEVEVNGETSFLVYSIIATVLTVILLLVILVMRKRIALVVALFHEASRCLMAVPCLLLQPICTYIVLLVFFIYWIVILAYMSTSAKPGVDKNGYVKYTEHETVSYMWWYHVIGLIWTSEFIIACEQLVISGSVARWYFRAKREYTCPICGALSNTLIYHLGSAALGALVITLVKFPRWVLMYIDRKLKESQSSCAQYCLRCCICCLWCLERCLKYLNANAYTVIAIEGRGFCSSAAKAFSSLVSNALRVSAINTVGDFILFLGKIGIMAATAAVGIIWFKNREELYFFAIPLLLVCIFAYFIANCFLSVYEMVVDALLLCFVVDCDINDGSPERPYHAGESLRSFIEDSGRKFKALEKNESGEEVEPVNV